MLSRFDLAEIRKPTPGHRPGCPKCGEAMNQKWWDNHAMQACYWCSCGHQEVVMLTPPEEPTPQLPESARKRMWAWEPGD
jgi:hypothetical protein